MKASPGELCGAPALSATYTAPEVKLSPKVPPIPPRKASSLSSVYKGRDISYIVMVTVQTIKPDNQTFNADSAMILKGFQLLPPG
jgi:hypothetical protein